MLYRKISERLKEYFSSGSDRLLVIDGARQIGKSYIIREIGSAMFPNYIELNMEEDKVGERIFAEDPEDTGVIPEHASRPETDPATTAARAAAIPAPPSGSSRTER